MIAEDTLIIEITWMMAEIFIGMRKEIVTEIQEDALM